MNRDGQSLDDLPTCSVRKSRWSAGSYLAAGFVAGCVAARSRLGKVSFLLVAGGLAWEFIRPRSVRIISSPQVTEVEPPLAEVELDEPLLLPEAEIEITSPIVNLSAIEPEPIIEVAPSAEVTAWDIMRERPSSFRGLVDSLAPAEVEISVATPSLSKQPTVPLQPMINIAQMMRPATSRLEAGDVPPSALEVVAAAEIDAPVLVKPTFEEPAVELVEAPVIVAEVNVPVEEEPEQATDIDLADLADELISTPGPVPIELPMLEQARGMAMPFHLDQASSAAWLLGLEPIPLVQDEPAWRKPLLAGIQSAFESPMQPPVPPTVAEAETAIIPDSVEIAVAEAFEALDAAVTPTEAHEGQKPPTHGLLGKLFEVPLALSPIRPKSEPLITAKTDSSPVIAPVAQDEIAEPEVQPRSAPASWLATELRETKRRTPALRPLPNNANSNAASLAAASPARSLASVITERPKKKSWLGLWK